eukprot:gnl/TRDRNA2_/TRDRNA2_140229_c1_seq3.p1 gnl/TRDRNA2_/TRDRNA2_140229_c1~~gnl/TRDRNA2_/TRDRNA2_140229_c1_seq3.p1  ORF type:complete len:208 (+),score=35.71 gnl/TRDRNA2_/TRDRNA2_140229_c1_seq3:124-747(+)
MKNTFYRNAFPKAAFRANVLWEHAGSTILGPPDSIAADSSTEPAKADPETVASRPLGVGNLSAVATDKKKQMRWALTPFNNTDEDANGGGALGPLSARDLCPDSFALKRLHCCATSGDGSVEGSLDQILVDAMIEGDDSTSINATSLQQGQTTGGLTVPRSTPKPTVWGETIAAAMSVVIPEKVDETLPWALNPKAERRKKDWSADD